MPKLADILTQLQFITVEAALLGLFITAAFILMSREWRSLVMALLVQYILVGLILVRLVRPDIAVLKIMIGAFICPILFLSAREVTVSPFAVPLPVQRHGWRYALRFWWQHLSLWQLLKGTDRRSDPASTGVIFRLLLTLLIILVARILSENFPLPDLLPNITNAVYWLILAGLMTLTLTEEPLKVGHGLLTVFTGFDLYFSTVEHSLLITGLWGSLNLLTALAIGYLIVAKGAAPEDEK